METDIVTEIVAGVMKVDPKEVKEDTAIIEDLGADSLDILRIVMNVEEKFLIKLPNDAVSKINSVNDIIKLINKQ